MKHRLSKISVGDSFGYSFTLQIHEENAKSSKMIKNSHPRRVRAHHCTASTNNMLPVVPPTTVATPSPVSSSPAQPEKIDFREYDQWKKWEKKRKRDRSTLRDDKLDPVIEQHMKLELRQDTVFLPASPHETTLRWNLTTATIGF
jgi:hypothetical protein